ncbi:hypothetical protein EC957_011237 [Mortierella hygrophila]|uniref:Uncharacterized protein n=1 Tax=Mortierella hygrophila TaxID=979708 RepID=A0A9P6EWD4_9FUNG|nr:hypothetical protein EC957_011237 [Mortierella hygrophila]
MAAVFAPARPAQPAPEIPPDSSLLFTYGIHSRAKPVAPVWTDGPHYFGMRNVYHRIEGYNVGVAKDRCLLGLVEEHEHVVKAKGRTLAALITKEIALEVDGGYGYTNNNADGRHGWRCGYEFRSPRRSNFLRILESFNEDLLSLCWKSKEAANDFFSLQDFSKRSAIEDRIGGSTDFSRFVTFIKDTIVDHLRRTLVVNFGPSTTDYCLLLPERHPGNMAHERMNVDVYCQLYFVVVPHLVDFAKSTESTTKETPLVLLVTIHKSIKSSGLEDLIETARQAVKARAVGMIGKPGTNERQEQVTQIEGRIEDKVSRGITIAKVDRSHFPAQYKPVERQVYRFSSEGEMGRAASYGRKDQLPLMLASALLQEKHPFKPPRKKPRSTTEATLGSCNDEPGQAGPWPKDKPLQPVELRSILERLSVEEQEHILVLMNNEETDDIDME